MMWPTRHSRPVVPLLMALVSTPGCAPVARPADTAVVASGADLEDVAPILAVHPLTRQVHRHLQYLTLVRNDSALAIVPYLAQRWDWSADHRDVRLVLAQGVRWHDGRPTTAADVAFTLRAARDPRAGSPRAAELAGIESVSVREPHEVELRFRAPRRTLPQVLAELPIIPAHRWAAHDVATWRTLAASDSSVGNGPMRLARRRRGESWVFERVPDFPAALGGPSALARVVVTVVDEPATKLAGLVSGSLDMAGVSPTMASLVARDSMLRLVSPPVLFSTVLLMHPGRAPFDDVRVRRALSRALDRRRLVDAALAGFGTPAGSAVPPGVLPGAAAVPRESVDEANALLDQAGWTRGADGVRRRGGRALEVE
ncbi:MAG: ABC transporter substrate-binding protein, partial [Gemmatimonadaceae bacterium]|nr:ABC transporter substrate-binding protein [Gemmatimonadaceae bacterium]